MAEKSKNNNTTGSAIPDSTDMVKNYAAIVEGIAQIEKTIVTNGLHKPKVWLTLKVFNKVLPKIMGGLVSNMKEIIDDLNKNGKSLDESSVEKIKQFGLAYDGIVSIITKISNSINVATFVKFNVGMTILRSGLIQIDTLLATMSLKTAAEAPIFAMMELYVKAVSGLVSIMTSVADIGVLTAINATLGLRHIRRFFFKLDRLMLQISNPIATTLTLASITNLVLTAMLLKMIINVMKSAALMAIIGIPAIIGMLFIGIFYKLFMSVLMNLVRRAALIVVGWEALKFIMLLTLEMQLIIVGFGLLGMFIASHGLMIVMGLAAFMLLVSGLIKFLDWVSMKTKDIGNGIKNLMWMTLGLVVFAIGVVFLMKLTSVITLGEVVKFTLFAFILYRIIKFITRKDRVEKIMSAQPVISAMCKDLLMFAASLFVIEMTAKNLDMETFGKMLLITGIIVALYKLMGKKTVEKSVRQSTITMSGVATSLIAFAAALMMTAITCKILGDWETFAMFTAVLGITGLIIGVYALIGIPAVAGFVEVGAMVMKSIGISLLMFAGALMMTALTLKLLKEKDIEKLVPLTNAVASMCATLMLNAVAIIAGTGLMAMISVPLLLFARALRQLAKASQEDIDSESLNSIVNSMKTLISKINEIAVLDAIEAVFKMSLLTPISRGVSKMAMELSDIAKLTFPLVTDENGNVKKFVKLDKDDFVRAGESVEQVITTVINCADKASLSGLAKAYVASAQFRKLRSVTEKITDMALDISQIAKLNVPVEWNAEGKAIKYKAITSTEFDDATKSLETIITFVTDKLASKDLIMKLTVMNATGATKTMGKFLESVSHIKDITDVVIGLAASQIPDEWTEDGKPKHYRSLTKEDYTNATDALCDIITSLSDAVMSPSVLTTISLLSRSSIKTMKNFFEAFGPVGNIIDGVLKLCSSVIPIKFNPETGEPTEYVSFSKINPKWIAQNIKKAIDAFCIGAIDASKTIDEDALEDANDIFEEINDSMQSLNTIIGSVTDMCSNEKFMNTSFDTIKERIDSAVGAMTSPFLTGGVLTTLPEHAFVKEKCKSLESIVDVAERIISIDGESMSGSINKSVDATNKFLTKLNSVDTSKLNAMDRITSNLAKFATSINGNFDALAECLSEDLVVVLEKLIEALKETNENITQKPTNVAPATIQNATKVGSEAKSKQSQSSTTQGNNNNSNLANILEQLNSITKQLKNGTFKVEVQNDEKWY